MDLTTLEKTTTEHPPRLVIYAPQGTGKSTLASQAPNVIFGDIEGGLDGIESAKQRLTSWEDVTAFITALHDQPHKFTTVAIDSADWLERLIFDQVCKTNRVASIDDIGYGKGYGFALDYWEMFLKGMNSLRDNRNMTVILLAHEKIKRFDDPMGQGYDHYMLKLNDKAAGLVQEWADAVLFMKTKTLVVTEKTGFNQDVKKAKDAGVYMYTKNTPAYQAKSRTSLNLPSEFPISKNSGWQDFVAQIGKGS